MSSPASTKVGHLFRLFKKLYDGEGLYPQKQGLAKELGVDVRTLRRYLNEIHTLYGEVILVEKKRVLREGRLVGVYRRIKEKEDLPKVVKFLMEETNELSWILPLILENDPSLLREEKKAVREKVEKMVAQDKELFLFRSNPFENVGDPALNNCFTKLKTAVKEREYRKIIYMYSQEEVLENAKCLKLIFSENNWYVAVETEQEELRMLRVAFIKEVQYAQKRNAYPLHILHKYHGFFETIQNPFTLHGVARKTAILKATPGIARYFKEGMKRFFVSQQFIQEHEDGSVEFRVDYTQDMEILPFIRRWLPDIVVLEPSGLKKALVENLQAALRAHKE